MKSYVLKGGLILTVAVFFPPMNVMSSDYIRLIESSPFPPAAAPVESSSAVRLSSVIEIFSKAGPIFNSLVVYHEFNKNLDASLQAGLKEANRLGQKGVLIQTQIFGTTTDAGTYYSLRGKGAYLIGVGNDPNDVCFASKCYQTLQGAVSSGVEPTEDTGYLWVERKTVGKGYQVSFYNTESIEGRARAIYLNEQARDAYRQAILGSSITGYATQLASVVKTQKEKSEVMELIKNRESAEIRYKEINTQLTKELRRAENAAKTSATLSSIAGVLSLASTIAFASISMGEDLSKSTNGSLLTKEDVINTLNSIQFQTGQRVKTLSLEQESIKNSINGYESNILRIGVKFLPPDSGSVIAPLP